MKKTLVYGAATAAVALTLGSCFASSCTSRETVESVYGPPPDLGFTDPDEVDPDDTDHAETPQPTPSQGDVDEPIEDVYGPPVPLDEIDPIDDETTIDLGVVSALYGPPPDLG